MKKIYFIAISFVLFFAYFQNAFAYSLGEQTLFYLDSVYAKKQTSIATLRYIGKNAYFYIDNAFFDSLSESQVKRVFKVLENLSNEYDSRIYPILTETFGKPPEPGIDGEKRIFILFTPLKKDVGGYISIENEFLNDGIQIKRSNEKEVIYLNTKFFFTNLIYPFLTHELQHLITFNQKNLKRKVEEVVWLNELRSEYAVDLLGYNSDYFGGQLKKRLKTFLKDPNDALLDWQNELKDYAFVAMLAKYLESVYGKKIFKAMIESDKVGIESINDALSKLGERKKFSDLFLDFILANYLNDRFLYGKYFGYRSDNFNNFKLTSKNNFYILPKTKKELFIFSYKTWQLNSINFNLKNNYAYFKFLSDAKRLKIAYIINFKNGSFAFNWFWFAPLTKNDFEIIDNNSSIKSITFFPVSFDNKKQFYFNIYADIKRGKDAKFSFVALKNNSLIKEISDYKIYMSKLNYIRHIPRYDIYKKFYFNNMLNYIRPNQFLTYKKSNLIKARDDYKVYLLDDKGRRHWLNMTSDRFLDLGYAFNQVFEISKGELLSYPESYQIK